MISFSKLLLAGASTFLLVHATVAVADEGDAFNLNAGITTKHDDNLFRLSPSVTPQTLGLSGKSDTITSTTVGLGYDKTFSLQRIIANVELTDTRYQKNGYLNFTALNYDVKWMWSLGTHWTGELAVDRAENLNSYSDYNNYGIRNKRITENEEFSVNYWFHADWAAVAGVYRNALTNEKFFLAESDYAGNGFNAGFRYRPRSGNSVTVRAKHMDARYAKRQFNPVLQFDNGFTQSSYETILDWQLAGKSKLRGRAEYIQRKHDHFSSRDYSGLVGNADFIYALSGKVKASVGYKHDLVSSQQQSITYSSSYYVADEPSVSLQWDATDKITAAARVGRGRRAYHGEISALPPGVAQREEKYTRGGVDLSYRPARLVVFKVGVAQENRSSNTAGFDYKDRSVFVSATLNF